MIDAATIKVTSLQRWVARARSTWQKAGAEFRSNYDLQDAAVLNVLCACELAIDLANMAIRSRQLGIPTDSRESFTILQREGYLPEPIAKSLKAMVGFRNIAVHQYHEIDFDIVEHILQHELNDVLSFVQLIRPIITS